MLGIRGIHSDPKLPTQKWEEPERKDLEVRLITSYPLIEGNLLHTAIFVSGRNGTVARFVQDLKHGVNVRRVVSINPIKKHPRSESESAVIQFMVNQEYTITNTVARARALGFNVEMYSGKEIWRVYFYNPFRYQIGNFIKELKGSFDTYEVHDVMEDAGMLYSRIIQQDLSPDDTALVQDLYQKGYFESPRLASLRDLSRTTGLSPSTLSRRIRNIESIIFRSFLRRK